MKKTWVIMVMTLIIFLAMSEKSLAPPYSVVCVDPGHGGPTAQKYLDNGYGENMHVCCYGLL